MASDENKNQGSPAGSSRDPQDPRAPQCHMTLERLEAEGLTGLANCPICGDYGKQVRVGAHPSQPAAAPTGTDLALCFPRPLCFPPVPPCAPPVPLVPLCFLLLTWPRVRCACVCLLCVVLLVLLFAMTMCWCCGVDVSLFVPLSLCPLSSFLPSFAALLCGPLFPSLTLVCICVSVFAMSWMVLTQKERELCNCKWKSCNATVMYIV